MNAAEEPIPFSGGDLTQYRGDIEEVLEGCTTARLPVQAENHRQKAPSRGEER